MPCRQIIPHLRRHAPSPADLAGADQLTPQRLDLASTYAATTGAGRQMPLSQQPIQVARKAIEIALSLYTTELSCPARRG